jgi:hypothetical protein
MCSRLDPHRARRIVNCRIEDISFPAILGMNYRAAGSRPCKRQEDYDLGALDWPQVDACGHPDETLARAKAALRVQ